MLILLNTLRVAVASVKHPEYTTIWLPKDQTVVNPFALLLRDRLLLLNSAP
jgi:hypothetical protein